MCRKKKNSSHGALVQSPERSKAFEIILFYTSKRSDVILVNYDLIPLNNGVIRVNDDVIRVK